MGIQDLNKILKSESPDSFITRPISELSGKRVGIDAFQWIFRFLRASGDEGVLVSFLSHLCVLRKNGVLPFCVFDGPGEIPEKEAEREKRKKDREELIRKKDALSEIFGEFDEEDCEEVPVELQAKARESLHKKKYAQTNLSDPHTFVQTLSESIATYEKQSIPLTNERVESVKNLLDVLGVRYIVAEGEGDGVLASYAIHGKIFAISSADTDSHAYGAPFTIPEIDVAGEKLTLVHREQYMEDLGLSKEQFLDLCILCGCDYNDRANFEAKTAGKRARGIGWKTALKLIKEHGSIEKIGELPGINIAPLKYERCRELFTVPEKVENIPPGSRPNKESLCNFLEENDVHFDAEYVIECWGTVKP
ncbi:putative Flap endonuclease [Brazilian marseillevirus]|uniref:putative Flap endonuclease n=1 Tax=Brazilian marseillevirus TaxID=1813599 RepID=UPI0007807514|nr:putative Flap endonuclease [Brazilian marseillevirus]AMQ10743.1 putative Flap endonuclease [Brazilian marseillevirus]